MADAADKPYDYVVVTTKAIPEVVTTAQILSPLITKDYADRFRQPTYILLQNGLGVERELYHALKALPNSAAVEPKIITCGLWIYTNLLAPNVVEHGDFVSLTKYLFQGPITSLRRIVPLLASIDTRTQPQFRILPKNWPCLRTAQKYSRLEEA